MKETKFSDEQIVKILREAESGEQTITAVCRAHGVHETTFYKWRRRFGGMEVSDAKRPARVGRRERPLEEITRRPLHGSGRDEGVTRKKVVSASRRAEALEWLQARGFSERRSCRLANLSRCGAHYTSRRTASDEQLADELRELATRYKRFGYRRAHAVMRREGQMINHKRVARLWRITGLSLPRRRPRRRYKPQPSTAPQQASRPNEVWTYDFIHDACASGRKLKLLTVTDEFTRESICVETRTSIKSRAVVEVLERLICERGIPAYLRSDNGPELVALQVRTWLKVKGVQTLYIEPGSPWQNAKAESFNGRLRDECLNMEWFRNLREAQVVIESWRRHYNEERPHSSLSYKTPVEFRREYERQQQQPSTLRL
jgi:putative transposase